MHEVNAVQLNSTLLRLSPGAFLRLDPHPHPHARYNGRKSSLNRRKDRQQSNRHMQHTCKYICNGLLTWRYRFQEINKVRGQTAAVELRTFLFQRFGEPQLNVHIYWFYRQARLSVISIQVNTCFILSNNILISPVVSVKPGWSTMGTFNSESQFFLTTLFRRNVGFVSLIFFFWGCYCYRSMKLGLY